MKGVLESIYDEFRDKLKRNKGLVRLEFIRSFVTDLQEHEYDAHIVIMGQNGNGKSMLMLELMKLIDESSITKGHILYSFHKTQDLIRMIKSHKRTVIGIDEMKKFFHYRMHSTTEQIVLTNMIEYARSNNLAFIGCTNDIRRINNNYRNSKVQMVIWLLDRFDDSDIGKSYGLVFLGNPALEEDDKFQMNAFSNLYTFEQIRYVAERLHTFCGYLFVEDIGKHVTEEELRIYKQNKEEGIRKEAERYAEKLEKKEEKSKEEEEMEIEKWYAEKEKEANGRVLWLYNEVIEKITTAPLSDDEYSFLEKKRRMLQAKIKLKMK